MTNQQIIEKVATRYSYKIPVGPERQFSLSFIHECMDIARHGSQSTARKRGPKPKTHPFEVGQIIEVVSPELREAFGVDRVEVVALPDFGLVKTKCENSGTVTNSVELFRRLAD